MLDLLLAATHHLLVFALAAALAAELVLLRPGLAGEAIGRLARIDRAYGGLAGGVILIGIGRVIFGLKSWEFYVHNPLFWAKMAAFAAVGLLSIQPTRIILRWSRQSGTDGAAPVPEADVATIRAYVVAQAAIFALIPVLAAAMARGIGS